MERLVAAMPGKINSPAELASELVMLLGRVNYHDIPVEFWQPVRRAGEQLNHVSRLHQVDRRQQRSVEATLVCGDQRHSVLAHRFVSHGFSVICDEWVKEGEVVELYLLTGELFSCAVIGCRRGSRRRDELCATHCAFYLMLSPLSDPTVGPLTLSQSTSGHRR